MPNTVRTRMAPSPTGFFHIGGLRTALYNFLYARKTGGKFVLRIEDTDQNRLVPGSLENIVETFSEFGISADEGPVWQDGQITEKGDKGPYLQSKRLETYNKHAQQLVDGKHAYYCFCTPKRLEELRDSQQAQKLPPKYDKLCLKLTPEEVTNKLAAREPYVIRLNVPAGEIIKFDDVIHGPIEISTNDVDDQVLVKSDGFPTYHLAVVIDDHMMEITHVLRGEEWIASTPKHMLLYRAFNWEPPVYAHLANILGKSGKKLSKRESDVSVKDFLQKGYLKPALLNFIAFLGWNPKTEQEIFSLDELIEQFDLAKLNKAGAVFDEDKLDWINGLYIRKLSPAELLEITRPYLVQSGYELEKYPQEFLVGVIALEQERLKKLSEIGDRVKYFFSEPVYAGDLLVWKKSDKGTIKKNLEALTEFLPGILSAKISKQELEKQIKEYIEKQGLKTGEVLWPLRVALSGLDASPGPFEILEVFLEIPDGKKIILERIAQAIKLL